MVTVMVIHIQSAGSIHNPLICEMSWCSGLSEYQSTLCSNRVVVIPPVRAPEVILQQRNVTRQC